MVNISVPPAGGRRAARPATLPAARLLRSNPAMVRKSKDSLATHGLKGYDHGMMMMMIMIMMMMMIMIMIMKVMII
jgi:hypothetical protein